jgi:SAM-dependent methyltransferase
MKEKPLTRFATVEDVMSNEFLKITYNLNEITIKNNLPDHSDVNSERYPWSNGFLGSPSLYAARMWEYPFAILAAELKRGMRCADIGCGMTPFTIYLKSESDCDVVGVDPDLFESGIKYKGHGVSQDYINKTGLKIIQSGMEKIDLPSNEFDRVFCLSVIEHVPVDIARSGIQEMARILKPGGRLIVTVDVNMHSEITNPLDLIWNSGLIPLGNIDLKWPKRRFGIFCDGKQPADVFGMTLIKDDDFVEVAYSHNGSEDVQMIPLSLVPTLRKKLEEKLENHSNKRPIWKKILKKISVLCKH